MAHRSRGPSGLTRVLLLLAAIACAFVPARRRAPAGRRAYGRAPRPAERERAAAEPEESDTLRRAARETAAADLETSDTSRRERDAAEPEGAETGEADAFDWTDVATKKVGPDTARRRAAELRAADRDDTIRVRWNQPITIAGVLFFVPLFFADTFFAISRWQPARTGRRDAAAATRVGRVAGPGSSARAEVLPDRADQVRLHRAHTGPSCARRATSRWRTSVDRR